MLIVTAMVKGLGEKWKESLGAPDRKEKESIPPSPSVVEEAEYSTGMTPTRTTQTALISRDKLHANHLH